MRTLLRGPIASAALAAWLALTSTSVNGQQTNSPIPPISEIRMERVPLSDAVKNLARQADLNFILDPRLDEPAFGPDGKQVPEPTVTCRWENLTAVEALDRLLKEHGLQAVVNPVTTVTRITHTNRATRPVDGNLFGGGTNTIPLIAMSSAPLAYAIKRIAAEAHLDVIVDPSLSDTGPGRGGRPTLPPDVSLRWKNLTAKQALLALCENYDLAVVKDAVTGAARIRFRAPQTAP